MYTKTTLLFIIITTISFFTNAQKIEKGTCFIGGNLSYLNTSQTYSNVGGYGGGYGVTTTYKRVYLLVHFHFQKWQLSILPLVVKYLI